MTAHQNTKRLAFSYFAVIMAMSLFFSVIIYIIISTQLTRPPSPPGSNQFIIQNRQADERFIARGQEVRNSILVSLAFINIAVAGIGGWLSYYLSRRTLRPIEQSMAVQAQFVSDASHELRTPLTALKTSNEVALRKPRISEIKAREVMTQTIAETEKLQALTESLLQLTAVKRPVEESIQVNAPDFLAVIRDDVSAIAEKKQIKITINAELSDVRLRPKAISQTLKIFIENAVNYSPNRSEITIGVSRLGESTQFFVRDNGIGIATADQVKIFDRFYRADSARTRMQNSGYGLGLAIAKQIAEINGYKVDCRSKLGKGSIFSITL